MWNWNPRGDCVSSFFHLLYKYPLLPKSHLLRFSSLSWSIPSLSISLFFSSEPAMSDEEHHFESKADAGASKTYPQQAGTIRKNGYIVIKARPCKVRSLYFLADFLRIWKICSPLLWDRSSCVFDHSSLFCFSRFCCSLYEYDRY